MPEKVSLYIVPTPIGNLEDITFRAVHILKSADLILCEDTRTSSHLLRHYEVSTPLKSFHAFNEHKTLLKVLSDLEEGKILALISDAGTPGISDPGYLLVSECIKKNIKISCLPGPTAFIPALVNSGFYIDRFTFEGFLPPKKGRQTRLSGLSEESRTMVFYESPYRLIKTLHDFKAYFGDSRRVTVSRELTKVFEDCIRGSLNDVIFHYSNKTIKGEIVIIVEGKKEATKNDRP
ncbi:MAG TPA: 16S rRNA (cytidine(1402)-2'-O)-methyltransferase [Cyclobacteriaceae bacterium]